MIGREHYREYRLSKNEAKLLDVARQARIPAERQKWLWPRDLATQPTGWDLFEAVWAVIADRHVVDVASIAPHPDGLPYFLAKPGRRVRKEEGALRGQRIITITHKPECAIHQGGGICNSNCGDDDDEWSPQTPNH